MKNILRIARAELRNLFYSPVAWFLAVVFMVQCAIFYTDAMYSATKTMEFYLKMPGFKGFPMSITRLVYLDGDGIFANVMRNLYLFVPLLTMGLLSREITNGSIKLLYSSPIKTRHIVFGKYLSLMIFNMILVCIVGVFMISSAFQIRHVDYGILLSSAFGFYLLVSAYAAIGLFMSSLTTYQIVSAIGSFLIIFILGRIGSLWQNIDFVRDITNFLSISGRTPRMLWGLITTREIIYFLVVICMFTGFTLLKLKSARESKPWYVTTGKYLSIIIIGLTVGYIFSRPGLIVYWDVSANKINTIHPRIQKIVKDLGDDDLEVTLYTNLLGRGVVHGLPANRNDYLMKLWEKYVRFKPEIKFKYEYYYDLRPGDNLYLNFPGKSIKEIAGERAKMLDLDVAKFKTPEEMKKTIDLMDESLELVMQLKYKGRTTFLRTFKDDRVWPDEEQVAAALARLQNQKMPKIIFVTGNLERDISNLGERGYAAGLTYKLIRESMVNSGFDVDTILLDTQDIPYKTENIAALVLADPKTKMSALKQNKINQFIASGGNMLILGETKKEDMVNPILENLGVQFEKGVLVEVTKHYPPDHLSPYLTRKAASLAEESSLVAKNKNNEFFYLDMETVVPITDKDSGAFNVEPLARALPGVWLKKGPLVRDSVPPVLNEVEGDYEINPFVISVALTRQINNKEQRIVVVGDADFLSNKFAKDLSFGRAVYSWLNYNEFPKYATYEPPKDTFLKVSSTTARSLKVVYVWIVPALMGLLGTVILIRRKRK